MALIKIIAAIGENNELGYQNKLLWNIKEDLQFFKSQTTNHKIIMGYKTYLSLPSKLSNRKYIVLTHHNISDQDIITFADFSQLIDYLNSLDETVYVIGGASVYNLFIPYANELILTKIAQTANLADAYFPQIDERNYIKELLYESPTNTNPTYCRIKYKRLK